MGQASRTNEWAAEDIDRFVIPRIFLPPARDLSAMLALARGGSALDVGAGTGVAAMEAMVAVGPRGFVVGLDPSREKLRLAQRKGLPWLVRGQVPGLPFPDAVFEGVLANFVLSHFRRYGPALIDMARVLKPGGRLGVTAWARNRHELIQQWEGVAESFVSPAALRDGMLQAIPWEEWFSEDGRVEEALEGAGLRNIAVERREYPVAMDVSEYLRLREISAQGGLVREMLGPPQWERFRARVEEAFRSRFRDPLEYASAAFLAVGTRPDGMRP